MLHIRLNKYGCEPGAERGVALLPLALKNAQENRGLARGGEVHKNKRKEKPEKEQNPLPGKFPVNQLLWHMLAFRKIWKKDYYGADGVYISYSGGKDSSVLMDIARKICPEITAVYVDTGLEYPEVREFVGRQDVEVLKPKMNFREAIEKYGYPFISKEVADCVYGARKYVAKLVQIEKGMGDGGKIPYPRCIADLAGVDVRADKENMVYQSLLHGEIPSTDIKAPARYLILQGKYLHTEHG